MYFTSNIGYNHLIKKKGSPYGTGNSAQKHQPAGSITAIWQNVQEPLDKGENVKLFRPETLVISLQLGENIDVGQLIAKELRTSYTSPELPNSS